ncbi:Multifunctional protein surE [Flexistipes sinusarabici DSM 4947]|uniref:5'-nucleotidase SurE n=2 Tax=Flexistipes sinusarabici TaxID=2352 RepID=F8E8M8_FLESM|nr:5'/3'-nucleotidase SurE [Flexistipes sinusarabici]AEI15151.1 Multifunctional protein surE [Flexistipes sinusarabici DSM 4947]HCW92536.1 5'/3'-nucleotidase SurE [Flexistipes sinusarabici]
MKVLITNDDGIYSKGIYELYKSISKIAEVVVVAPIKEQSAVGHAITVKYPLRLHEVNRKGEFFGYGVEGTPADCVKLAFDDIITIKPDLVVSGINHGANLASNVIYSGTVSAATEGAMLGVKSMAVSLASIEYTDFSAAADFAAFFAKYLHNLNDYHSNLIFNINVPPLERREIKGWKFTKQGKTRFMDTFEKRLDPRGNTYFWLKGEKTVVHRSQDCDDYLLEQGFVSVTPIKYDLTDYSLYEKLKNTEGVKEWK